MSGPAPDWNAVNHCGGCTLCCKLLGVEDLAPMKPPDAWCPHCAIGRGCSIFPDRPRTCRTYVCTWRQMREEGLEVADQLRPDRCGVIIDSAADETSFTVRCDPAKPEAWKRPDVQRLLAGLSRTHPLALVIAGRLRWLRASPV